MNSHKGRKIGDLGRVLGLILRLGDTVTHIAFPQLYRVHTADGSSKVRPCCMH